MTEHRTLGHSVINLQQVGKDTTYFNLRFPSGQEINRSLIYGG